MWNFLARNKQVAAMLGLLSLAAVVAIILTTKGASNAAEDIGLEETEDISPASHVFSTHKWVIFLIYECIVMLCVSSINKFH